MHWDVATQGFSYPPRVATIQNYTIYVHYVIWSLRMMTFSNEHLHQPIAISFWTISWMVGTRCPQATPESLTLWFTAVERDRNWTLQLQHQQFQWGPHLQPPHSGSSSEESRRLQAEQLQPSQGPQPQQGVLIQKGQQRCALSQVGCTTITNKGFPWEQYS